jgi:hypothetical protein
MNITRATVIIFLDTPRDHDPKQIKFTIDLTQQAIGRSYRYGQTRDISVYQFSNKNKIFKETDFKNLFTKIIQK